MGSEKSAKHPGLLWMLLGLLFLLAALSLAAYNLFDSARAKQASMQAVHELESLLPEETSTEAQSTLENQGYAPAAAETPAAAEEPTSLPDYILFPDMEMPVETINGVDYIGVLRIPVLDLELPVISQWSYPNLKIAPCRYSGSAYLNNLVICGHNYTAHFGRLKELAIGDTVAFTDMNGNTFSYQLAERETLMPGAVDEMESGDWDLTLFTCTVGGQSRVTLRFEQIS